MRRPRHEARQGRDHARHPERRRRGPEGPRRVGHRAHRRRGEAGRHPRRQDHAEGRDAALSRGEAPPRHLRREGRRRPRQLAPGPAGRRAASSSTRASSPARARRRTSARRTSRTRSARASRRCATRRSRSSATRSSARSRSSSSARRRRASSSTTRARSSSRRAPMLDEAALDEIPRKYWGELPVEGAEEIAQKLRELEEIVRAPRGALPRQDRSPLQGRRAAAGRHQDGEGLHRHQAQAPGRRQDGRSPRQQGRHLAASCRKRTCRTCRTARRSTSCSTRSAFRAA